MAYYGYEPGNYVPNYSWIGATADTVAKLVKDVPGLIEADKALQQNKVTTEALQKSFYNHIDTITPDELKAVGIDDSSILKAQISARPDDINDPTKYVGEVTNIIAPIIQKVLDYRKKKEMLSKETDYAKTLQTEIPGTEGVEAQPAIPDFYGYGDNIAEAKPAVEAIQEKRTTPMEAQRLLAELPEEARKGSVATTATQQLYTNTLSNEMKKLPPEQQTNEKALGLAYTLGIPKSEAEYAAAQFPKEGDVFKRQLATKKLNLEETFKTWDVQIKRAKEARKEKQDQLFKIVISDMDREVGRIDKEINAEKSKKDKFMSTNSISQSEEEKYIEYLKPFNDNIDALEKAKNDIINKRRNSYFNMYSESEREFIEPGTTSSVPTYTLPGSARTTTPAPTVKQKRSLGSFVVPSNK